MYGIFHPFQFYKEPLDCTARYSLGSIDFIFKGHVTADLINVKTGVITPLAATTFTWTINDVEYKSTRITGSLSVGVEYYFRLTINPFNKLFDGIITRSEFFCNKIIDISNECSNEWHDWENDASPLSIEINGDLDIPEFTTKSTIRVSDGVEINKSKVSVNNVLVGILPKGFTSILNAAIGCDIVTVGGVPAANISVSTEPINEDYARISFLYQEKIAQNDNCCEIININDVVNGVVVGGGCVGFEVEIVDTSGVLSADITDAPIGEALTYKWFRNGLLQATTATLDYSEIGTFKVEVKAEGGCIATASVNIASECQAISITPFMTGNFLNANILNAPDGVTYKIFKQGVEIGTALPIELTLSDTYFIEVITSKCSKKAGIVVDIIDTSCIHTIGISKTGNVLTAITDAVTPTYLWEYEGNSGKVTIGSGSTVLLNESGNYHLTITKDGCIKNDYLLYLKDNDCFKVEICNPEELISNPYKIVEIIKDFTGSSVTLTKIDLDLVNNFADQLTVKLNGIDLTYVITPTQIDHYTVSGDDIVLFEVMTNSDLHVILN